MGKAKFTPPFLKEINLLPERADFRSFPFDRLKILDGERFRLTFSAPVTFFIGENGTGKSTVLSAIAELCGFHSGGGSQWHSYSSSDSPPPSNLAPALRASWLPKVVRGFYFRSDTFAGLARYLDEEGDSTVHGGIALRQRSHGESLIALFTERFGARERSLYLLDEPENALSPTRQLALLRLIRDWESTGNVQVIIATHSPILMSYPRASLLSFDEGEISELSYEDTEHYRITRSFLLNPRAVLAELFGEGQN